MLHDNNLTPPGTTAVPKDLVPRLLCESLPVTRRILAEELPGLESDGNTTPKYRQVREGPHIPAVDTPAYLSTVRTFSIREPASGKEMVFPVRLVFNAFNHYFARRI